MTQSQRERKLRTNPWFFIGELAYLALTFGFILTLSFWTMIAWQLVSLVTLVVGFAVLRRRAVLRLEDPPDRVGLPRVTAWVLPFASSLVGIVAVFLIMYARETTELGDREALLISVGSATGVVLSWMMLQVGFAQVYDAALDKDPSGPGLSFPHQSEPQLIDFVYFSFTVGVSFATSDVDVNTPRMRLTVLAHSIVGFFYNALVVALAFQVIQNLGQ